MAAIPDDVVLLQCMSPTVTVKGTGRIDPALTNKFAVTIVGLWHDYRISGGKEGGLSFSKISGLGSSLQTEAIRQGTSPITTHTPIGITYNDVTLELAVTTARNSMAVMRWYRDTAASVFSSNLRSTEGFPDDGATLGRVTPRDVTIKLPTHRVHLIDAWPVSASFGDLNANSSEVWIYSLTLKYAGIKIDLGSSRAELPYKMGLIR